MNNDRLVHYLQTYLDSQTFEARWLVSSLLRSRRMHMPVLPRDHKPIHHDDTDEYDRIRITPVVSNTVKIFSISTAVKSIEFIYFFIIFIRISTSISS
jgi:hypothetical protein